MGMFTKSNKEQEAEIAASMQEAENKITSLTSEIATLRAEIAQSKAEKDQAEAAKAQAEQDKAQAEAKVAGLEAKVVEAEESAALKAVRIAAAAGIKPVVATIGQGDVKSAREQYLQLKKDNPAKAYAFYQENKDAILKN